MSVTIFDYAQAQQQIATDLISSQHYQLLKLVFGSIGSQQIVDDTHGLPVALIATTTQPITPPASTQANTSRVNSNGTTPVNLLASVNLNRVGASGYNDSAVELYVKAGTGASATSKACTVAPKAFFFVFPLYKGVVTSAHPSTNGAVDVTEYIP